MCTDKHPGVFLLQDLLGCLGECEGFARAIGPHDEDGRQLMGDTRGYGYDGFLLFGIESTVPLLTPLSVSV